LFEFQLAFVLLRVKKIDFIARPDSYHSHNQSNFIVHLTFLPDCKIQIPGYAQVHQFSGIKNCNVFFFFVVTSPQINTDLSFLTHQTTFSSNQDTKELVSPLLHDEKGISCELQKILQGMQITGSNYFCLGVVDIKLYVVGNNVIKIIRFF